MLGDRAMNIRTAGVATFSVTLIAALWQGPASDAGPFDDLIPGAPSTEQEVPRNRFGDVPVADLPPEPKAEFDYFDRLQERRNDPCFANARTRLQCGLKELGYYAGPLDGNIGPASREAIRAFQRDHDMEVDGKYSGLLSFDVEREVRLARERATPEGQAREKERQRLLAMTDAELIEAIKGAGTKEEAERLFDLIPVERARDLPFTVFFEFPGAPRGLREATEMVAIREVLGGLYYPRSEQGVRQFQEDLGAQATGTLTIGQWEELIRRWTRLRDTEIWVSGFGDELSISRFEGYVKTEGTWIIEDDQIAYPVNRSEVICRRELGECLVTQADVMVPQLDDSEDSYGLQIRSNTYSIVSWDADEVVARSSGRCRTTLLTINSNSREVFEVTRNNETEACREGTILSSPSLDKPRIARLVPGFTTTWDWWQERKKKVREYINPRYKAKMEGMVETLSKGPPE